MTREDAGIDMTRCDRHAGNQRARGICNGATERRIIRLRQRDRHE